MKKIVFLFLPLLIWAVNLAPIGKYKAQGNVIDIVVSEGKLYAGTDAGKLNIFEIDTKKIIKTIQLKQIEDFMGDLYNPKIFSVDITPNQKRILILAEATGGTRELFIYENEKLKKIIPNTMRLFIKKAKFIDNDKILFALLSNEIILYDLPTGKFLYRKQLSLSTFSDFMLDETHKKAAVTCESGKVFYIDVGNGKILKTLKGANVDNVYKIDMKKDKLITAGQDRRVGIYNLDGSYKFLKANFLVYSVALSPDAKIGAYAMDEQNNIGIIDTTTLELKFKLVGQGSTLNTILFVGNKHLFSASDDPYILEWRLK